MVFCHGPAIKVAVFSTLGPALLSILGKEAKPSFFLEFADRLPHQWSD